MVRVYPSGGGCSTTKFSGICLISLRKLYGRSEGREAVVGQWRGRCDPGMSGSPRLPGSCKLLGVDPQL